MAKYIQHETTEVSLPSLLDVLSFRWGRFHETLYMGNRSYASRGWGIDLYYVAFDASRVLSDESTFKDMSYQSITARVPIGHAPANFWPRLLRALQARRAAP